MVNHTVYKKLWKKSKKTEGDLDPEEGARHADMSTCFMLIGVVSKTVNVTRRGLHGLHVIFEHAAWLNWSILTQTAWDVVSVGHLSFLEPINLCLRRPLTSVHSDNLCTCNLMGKQRLQNVCICVWYLFILLFCCLKELLAVRNTMWPKVCGQLPDKHIVLV